ncbi:hypothetical protein JX266_003764 [Neoarthrinium moseri]|nr:hypothetical protein JX266_003764 [Neoarthrinium moseri]
MGRLLTIKWPGDLPEIYLIKNKTLTRSYREAKPVDVEATPNPETVDSVKAESSEEKALPDTTAQEEEEAKDTVGPIPSGEKSSKTRPGKHHFHFPSHGVTPGVVTHQSGGSMPESNLEEDIPQLESVVEEEEQEGSLGDQMIITDSSLSTGANAQQLGAETGTDPVQGSDAQKVPNMAVVDSEPLDVSRAPDSIEDDSKLEHNAIQPDALGVPSQGDGQPLTSTAEAISTDSDHLEEPASEPVGAEQLHHAIVENLSAQDDGSIQEVEAPVSDGIPVGGKLEEASEPLSVAKVKVHESSNPVDKGSSEHLPIPEQHTETVDQMSRSLDQQEQQELPSSPPVKELTLSQEVDEQGTMSQTMEQQHDQALEDKLPESIDPPSDPTAVPVEDDVLSAQDQFPEQSSVQDAEIDHSTNELDQPPHDATSPTVVQDAGLDSQNDAVSQLADSHDTSKESSQPADYAGEASGDTSEDSQLHAREPPAVATEASSEASVSEQGQDAIALDPVVENSQGLPPVAELAHQIPSEIVHQQHEAYGIAVAHQAEKVDSHRDAFEKDTEAPEIPSSAAIPLEDIDSNREAKDGSAPAQFFSEEVPALQAEIDREPVQLPEVEQAVSTTADDVLDEPVVEARTLVPQTGVEGNDQSNVADEPSLSSVTPVEQILPAKLLGAEIEADEATQEQGPELVSSGESVLYHFSEPEMHEITSTRQETATSEDAEKIPKPTSTAGPEFLETAPTDAELTPLNTEQPETAEESQHQAAVSSVAFGDASDHSSSETVQMPHDMDPEVTKREAETFHGDSDDHLYGLKGHVDDTNEQGADEPQLTRLGDIDPECLTADQEETSNSFEHDAAISSTQEPTVVTETVPEALSVAGESIQDAAGSKSEAVAADRSPPENNSTHKVVTGGKASLLESETKPVHSETLGATEDVHISEDLATKAVNIPDDPALPSGDPELEATDNGLTPQAHDDTVSGDNLHRPELPNDQAAETLSTEDQTSPKETQANVELRNEDSVMVSADLGGLESDVHGAEPNLEGDQPTTVLDLPARLEEKPIEETCSSEDPLVISDGSQSAVSPAQHTDVVSIIPPETNPESHLENEPALLSTQQSNAKSPEEDLSEAVQAADSPAADLLHTQNDSHAEASDTLSSQDQAQNTEEAVPEAAETEAGEQLPRGQVHPGSGLEPMLEEKTPVADAQPPIVDSRGGLLAGIAAGAAAITAGAGVLAHKLSTNNEPDETKKTSSEELETKSKAISSAPDSVIGVSEPVVSVSPRQAPDVPPKSPERGPSPAAVANKVTPNFADEIMERSQSRLLSNVPRERDTDSIMGQSPPSKEPLRNNAANVSLAEHFTHSKQTAAEEIIRGSDTNRTLARSGMQTGDDSEFRPKVSTVPYDLNGLLDTRSATPGIVLPDLADPTAKSLGRARSLRRSRRRTIRRNEETVAAAVIIYAAAREISPSPGPRLGSSQVEKGIVETMVADADFESVMTPGAAGDRGVDLSDVSDSVTDLSTDDEGKTSSSDRHRRHRHRSSKSGESERETAHRSRRKSDASAKSATSDLFIGSRSAKRTDSGFSADSSHSSRRQRTPEEQAEHDKRRAERRAERTPEEQAAHDRRKEERRAERRTERTPEEQAAHDKRKEERRAIQEKEREREAKGKAPDTTRSDRHSHRSSRRYSEHSNSSRPEKTSHSNDSPVSDKKFFDLKNAESAVAPKLTKSATDSAVPVVSNDVPRPDTTRRSRTSKDIPGRPTDVPQTKEHRTSKDHHHKHRDHRDRSATDPVKTHTKPATGVEEIPSPSRSKSTKEAKESKEERHHRREERQKARDAEAKKRHAPSGLKAVIKKIFK